MTEPVQSRRSVTLICGLSGYGKNTFAIRYLLNAPLAAKLCFDPECNPEFSRNVNEFAARLRRPQASHLFEMSIELQRSKTVCFDPHTIFPGNPAQGLEFFCEWAWMISERIAGEKAVVVDEIWNYVSPHTIPEPIRKLALSGRKRRIQLLCLTQEPNRLNTTLKAGVSEIICFRLQGSKALDWATDYGFNAAELDRLPPLHWVAKNCDSGAERRGVLKL